MMAKTQYFGAKEELGWPLSLILPRMKSAH
jgi:hypothetical protein